jgi:O-antigen/teichoic acid export membrane protein
LGSCIVSSVAQIGWAVAPVDSEGCPRFPRSLDPSMLRVAQQAALLSIARMASFGLMIISPLVLVRFLTVTDFGRYREFLLYISILGTLASFSISQSLLYFIPLHPRSTWRVVKETTGLTAIISSAVVVAFVALDLLVPGGLVGPYLLPVAL